MNTLTAQPVAGSCTELGHSQEDSYTLGALLTGCSNGPTVAHAALPGVTHRRARHRKHAVTTALEGMLHQLDIDSQKGILQHNLLPRKLKRACKAAQLFAAHMSQTFY